MFNIINGTIKKLFLILILSLFVSNAFADDILNKNPNSNKGTFSERYSNNSQFSNQNKSYSDKEAQQYGTSYGMGQINSGASTGITNLVKNSRAKLGFFLDSDNKLTGEGDVLLPLYDGKRSVAFLQTGARSMPDDRWILNAGLGQRLILSDDWLIGYNTFLDQDITRDHTRGGVGLEAWHKFIRFSSNYYVPLSKWRESKDIDGYEERAARGWDIRTKGYLPFYQKVAVTGGFTQWYGDNVAVFNKDTLEKNPKIWSYGLEYAPIPLITTSVAQKHSEKGQSDTEVGLFFTYDFSKSWEDMTSLDMPNRNKSIIDSRFDFVDRENKIILNYRKIPITEIGFIYLTTDRNIINNNEIDDITLHLRGLSNPAGQPVLWEIVSGGELATLTNISPTTDIQGDNTVRLVANPTGKGDVMVKATLNGMSVFTVIKIDTPPPTVELSANPSSILINEPSIITLALSNTDISVAKTVAWEIVSGPATMVSEETTTNTTTGKAEFKIKGTAIGTVRIKATVDGVEEFINIEVLGVTSASLTSDLNEIGIGESLNLEFVLAGVNPLQGNSVTWKVDSSSTGLGLFSNVINSTDINGVATAQFTGLAEGPVKFVVTSAGIATTYNINIINRATAILIANPTSIDVKGQSTLTFTFGGIADISGKTVTWLIGGDAGSGTLANSLGALTTDAGGQAINYLNGVATGTVIIQATCEGEVATATIEVGRNTKANLSVNKNSMNFGEGNVVATLQVSGITPLSGRNVTWSVTGSATLDTASNSTDIDGKAIVNITPTDGGEIVVSATVDGVVSSQTINVTRTPNLLLNVSNNVNLYSQITADITLSNIAIPDGQTINWEITSGGDVAKFTSNMLTATSTTAGVGRGNIAINTIKEGTFVLKASVAGLEQYVTVVVLNNATATLIANPNTVLINQNSNLSFNITGLGNTAVRNITWEVVNDSGCTLTAGNTTDTNGNASGTFKCANPGMYEIKVSGEGKSISTYVNVIEQMSLSISSPQSTIDIGESLNINALISGLVNPNLKTITWSVVNSPSNVVTPTSASTSVDSSGNSSFQITARNPGTATITANVDGVIVNIVITVRQNATATLTSNKSTMIFSDTDGAILTFNLSGLIDVDAKSVAWEIISGTGALGSASTSTNSAGIATNTVTSSTAGPLQIRASAGGASADFIIDIYEVPRVVLNASPIYIQEGETTNLTATLSGVSNLSGKTITWTNVTGGGSITNSSPTTDVSGQGTAIFSPNSVGTYKLAVEINGFSDFITIEVSVSPKDATLTANPVTSYVGDDFDMILALTGGGPLDNKTVNWSVIGGDGEATLPTITTTTTDISGNTHISLKAIRSGDVRIRAEVVGIETVEYTVTILDKTFLNITASKDTLIIDDEVIFTLQLSGTGTLDNKAVAWSRTLDTITSIVNEENLTYNNGKAQLTLKSLSSGITTITATVGGISSSYTINIVEKPIVSLVADRTTILSGSSTDINLQISHAGVLDNNTVAWSIEGSGNTFANLSNEQTATSGGGKAKATLNATAPGTVVVKATTTMDDLSKIESYVTITILPDYSVTLSTTKTTIKLGENLPLNFALLGGYSGADLDGKLVTWSLSDYSKASVDGAGTTSGGGLSINNLLASSDLSKTGLVTITATSGGKSASININIVDSFTTTLTASSTSIDYGTTSTLTLALSPDTNVLQGRNVIWEVVSGGSLGTLTPVNITTLANGTAQATVKGTGAGTIRIKASVGGVDKFIDIVVNNSITTSLNATSYTVVTGNSTNLTFALGNFNGMSMDNLDIVWEIDSSSTGTGTLATLTGKTNALGVAENVFNGALNGTVKVKATLTAFGKSSMVTINVINSPILNITAPKSTIYVGESLALTTNIISGVDVLANQTVTWAIESGTATATLTPVTLQTNSLGKAVANISSTTSGTANISATILGVKTYYTVNIISSPVVSLSVPKYSIIKNEPLNVTMTLSGIPSVSGKAVAWSIASGTATISPINTTTLGNGTAVATVTSNTLGSFTVRAIVEGITRTIVIDVVEIPVVTLTSLRSSISTGGYTTLTANLSGVTTISGQVPTWEIVSGTTVAHFAIPQRVTDINGNATIRLYADTPGTVRIKVTINGISAFVNVEVKSSAKVTASCDFYNLGYNDKATITAILSNYTPLDGQEIQWEVIEGADYININGKDKTTNKYGSGTLIIHNKTDINQKVVIKVTIAGVSDTITINLIQGGIA